MFYTGVIVAAVGLLTIIYSLFKPKKIMTILGFILFFGGAFVLILDLI